jgi:hypothetical protein
MWAKLFFSKVPNACLKSRNKSSPSADSLNSVVEPGFFAVPFPSLEKVSVPTVPVQCPNPELNPDKI